MSSERSHNEGETRSHGHLDLQVEIYGKASQDVDVVISAQHLVCVAFLFDL